MNDLAIIRDGDDDDNNRTLKGDIITLRDHRPDFVKWEKSKCTIVFVGMYTIKQNNNEYITIYSLPKYYPVPEDKYTSEHISKVQHHIKKICEVVEKLKKEKLKEEKRKKKNIFDDEEFLFDPYAYDQNVKTDPVNRFELAEYIIEDYLQNGLYVKDFTETRKGGFGRVGWGRTVAKIQPVIQDDGPVYLDLMNRHHMIDENDLISVIHANVLNQCLDFIGPLISDGIEYIDTEPLGEDLSHYSSTINARSTYVFKEREINLFKALEAWCDCTRFYKNYAGVTCFDRVWEWVNDSVWGNTEHPESERPTYHIAQKNYSGGGEAIPDTIRIEDNEGEKEVFIFDSKYYTIKSIDSKNSQIYGFPANSDIVKQVAYLKLIKSQYSAKYFYNLFLLPESYDNCEGEEKGAFRIPSGKWFTTIGFVKPGAFNLDLNRRDEENDDEERVGIIFINPEKLYERYLKGSEAEYSDLSETKSYLLCSQCLT